MDDDITIMDEVVKSKERSEERSRKDDRRSKDSNSRDRSSRDRSDNKRRKNAGVPRYDSNRNNSQNSSSQGSSNPMAWAMQGYMPLPQDQQQQQTTPTTSSNSMVNQQRQMMAMMQNLSNNAPPPPPPPPSVPGGGQGDMQNMNMMMTQMNQMMNQMSSQMANPSQMNNQMPAPGPGDGNNMNNMAEFMKWTMNNMNSGNSPSTAGPAQMMQAMSGGQVGGPGMMPNSMPSMNPSANNMNQGGGGGGPSLLGAGPGPHQQQQQQDQQPSAMIGPEKPDEDDGKHSGMKGLIPTQDPNLAAAWGGWVMTPDGQMTRQPIVYHKSVLYPPNPNAPAPTLREKPGGCRTVFIGGTPDKADEDILRDVFERCGPIQTCRLNKKNFAHIRFMNESAVDHAVLLSGWRLKVDNNSDQPYTSKIHVDYAQARDDKEAYERMLAEQERSEFLQRRALLDMNRPASPPGHPTYSDREANRITEDLKLDDKYEKAAETLVFWLNSGECNKRNSMFFFNMIQAAMTHVKKLASEKHNYEEQMKILKDQWKLKISMTSVQFDKISNVLDNCTVQKVWDHFTKAQRKNISTWKQQYNDAKSDFDKNACIPEDSSDEEVDIQPKAKKQKKSAAPAPAPSNPMDPESLLEAAKNWQMRNNPPVEDNEAADEDKNKVAAKAAHSEAELKQAKNKIKLLQQTLQGLQKQLLEMHQNKDAAAAKKERVALSGSDSRLVAVLSTYLISHCYPVSTEAIWNHVFTLDHTLDKKQIEKVLGSYSDCFECVSDDDDGKMWKFIALGPGIGVKVNGATEQNAD